MRMLPVLVLATLAGAASALETVTVQPERDDGMLLNPDKGWVQYYGADKYTQDFISVGYTRWAWSVLEPQEGRFNWKEIDAFIGQFKHYGKKTAFGVMSRCMGAGASPPPLVSLRGRDVPAPSQGENME